MPKVLGLVFSVSKGVSFCETIPDANPTWLNSAHRPTPDSNPSPSYLSLMVIRALAALSLFDSWTSRIKSLTTASKMISPFSALASVGSPLTPPLLNRFQYPIPIVQNPSPEPARRYAAEDPCQKGPAIPHVISLCGGRDIKLSLCLTLSRFQFTDDDPIT